MGLADPEALEALAAKLDGRAEDVREQYRLFRASVTEVRWHSDGAQDYRDQCARLVGDLEGNARELNDAADDLRRHARSVRDKLEWIDDMVDELRERAEEAWDDAKGAFDWGQDKVAAAKDKVLGWL